MQDMWVQSLGQEDALEEEMATHSSLASEIPWTEESGRLLSMGSHRVGHNLVTKNQQQVQGKWQRQPSEKEESSEWL